MPRTAGSRNCIRLIALSAIFLWLGPCHAIDIVATGSWTLSTGSGNLIAGAGSNLLDSYHSDLAQVALTINNTSGNGDFWRVDVRRSDVSWPTGLTLYVKRTSAGAGGGFIVGGTGYQEVTTSDASFFIGSGNRTGVNVQLQIGGASIDVPPNTYSTSVVYTVVDTS